MNKRNYLIGAAVAATLTCGYASAATVTLSQAANPTFSLIVAGSSAAQSSIATAVENDLCGGVANTTVIQSNATTNANKNFFAYSCTTATAVTGIPQGTLITVYYRSEGGSVMGAMPIATGTNILHLNLGDSSCAVSGAVGTCTVTGVTATNGSSDSWAGAVTEGPVQLGVTDVEPGQLISADYPTNYTVFPTATPAQLAALPKVRAVQQVFGLAVNTSGLTLSTAGTVNLSRESAANILLGHYTDWSAVPDALNGNKAVTTSAAAIIKIDREPGSGTRTAANLYFMNYGCGSAQSIVNSNPTANPKVIQGNFVQTNGTVYLVNSPPGSPLPEQMNYATGDELALANSNPGAIAYASIDNLLPPKNTAYTNLTLATIGGVAPSTLTAASGAYDFWYEATLVPGTTSTGNGSSQLSTFLQSDIPKLATAPIAADINVIPGVGGNSASVPTLKSASSGTTTIYVNPYSRGGNSCNAPSETNE
jgi:hypothetical protein